MHRYASTACIGTHLPVCFPMSFRAECFHLLSLEVLSYKRVPFRDGFAGFWILSRRAPPPSVVFRLRAKTLSSSFPNTNENIISTWQTHLLLLRYLLISTARVLLSVLFHNSLKSMTCLVLVSGGELDHAPGGAK